MPQVARALDCSKLITRAPQLRPTTTNSPTMPEEGVSSPNEGGGGEAVDGGTPRPDGSAAATEKEETEKWFIEMRGWIMVLAVQVASFTYQAGLNPPGGFSDSGGNKGSDDKESTNSFRYKVFFYSNTTAFLTSLAIIILLMNRSFYGSVAKVTVLEIIVVLDMMGLMAAYWAGSTRKNQTNMFALVLTALVLFVIYVVFAVQLVQKLRAFFPDVVRRRVSVSVLARAATRDDGDGGTPPVPNQQDIDDTRAPPLLDVGRYKSESELRRRDSRLLARTPGTGKPTILSP